MGPGAELGGARAQEARAAKAAPPTIDSDRRQWHTVPERAGSVGIEDSAASHRKLRFARIEKADLQHRVSTLIALILNVSACPLPSREA